MSINIGDNFKYLGKKFLDDRESFNTILDMKNCNDVPNGFITFCKENNKRYEYMDSNEIDEVLGKWREFTVGVDIDLDLLEHDCAYVGNETPEDDNLIWFDDGEGVVNNLTYDNPLINELFACIRTLQDQVQQLQADVEYLKIHGGGGPINPDPGDKPDDDNPDEIVDVMLALEDGGLFLLEDGGYMLLEESMVVTSKSTLTLEDGGLFLLEDGGYMLLEENLESIEKSLMLLENGSRMLLENGNNILLENI